MATIRPPAVAGSFYPRDAAALRAMVDGFLAEAGTVTARGAARAVIAPHAGYVYSGAVAGRAFAALGSEVSHLRRAVVVGPSHFVPFRGIAAPSANAFRTPLGEVPLDRAAIDMLDGLPQTQISDRPHDEEHSVEVELPFLQTVLDDFAVVPLVVGDAEPAEVAEVFHRFLDDEHALIVVSSDLSHYHDYGTAKRLDAATAAKIERLDESGLGPNDACGHLPIAGLLIAARERGLEASRLDLRNSGDTAGPRDRVVGYGAWAFSH
jgi:AmmeMemoRadiSam system protein B